MKLLIPLTLVLSALCPVALAQSTAFTYQGRLKNDAAAAAGLHDFRFRLWDASAGGTQLGTTQCVDNILVAEGLFNATIDFGQQFTTPNPRFIEIEVRADSGLNCANAGGFVVLAPRQPISSTPRANAATVANALSAPDGSPANAVFVDNAGKVGIGTTTPLHALHTVADAAALRLQDNDDPASFALLEDSQPSQMRLNKVTSVGSTLIDINPTPLDGTGEAKIRFFRLTNTTGVKNVVFNSGNNSTAASAVIGVGGNSSAFQLDGGDFGIGTLTPLAKLDVRGDIRLGTSGQFLATAGEENLRIIRGAIHGLNGTVVRGTGFTCEHVAEGRFRITFDTPFLGTPTATANAIRFPLNVAMVSCEDHTSSAITFVVHQDAIGLANFDFQFMVVGPG